MKIGLITDSIRDKSTGIGFYAKDIIQTIMSIDKKNDYVFVDFIKTEFNKYRLVQFNNPSPYFKTYLWHNYLPLVSKNSDIDTMINFSACPHWIPFKQKEIFFVYDVSWYLYPEYHRKGRVLYHQFLFQTSLKNSYKIVVDSISTKNDLVKYFKISDKKIHVIYPSHKDNTKDVKKIKYAIDFPYILFIGTMEPRKNVESIIKAYKHLKDTKNIKQKLIICGKKGWLFENIFNLIKKFDLEKDVHYFGYITNEEKKYLYKHADFFVYPSFYEGFGIPVLEAMSNGCPVITSTISSLPEVAGKAALLVDPDSVEQLTIAMDRLIKDKKLREELAVEGNNQIKKLTNTKQIEQLLEILKR